MRGPFGAQTRAHSMIQLPSHVLPPSWEMDWRQRHEVGVILSHTPAALIGLSPCRTSSRFRSAPSIATSITMDCAHRKLGREGWVEAEIPVESIEYSARQLLRLGAEIEVVSPPSLRAAVAAEVGKVAAIYAKA